MTMTQFLNHIARRLLYTTMVCLVLSRGVAGASFLFDFEAVALDQFTPFSATNNGVQAMFSNFGDPAFVVQTTGTLFAGLTGNALFQFMPPTPLDIQFDSKIGYIQLSFGSIEPGELSLTAFNGLNQVGQSTATSSPVPGGLAAEGFVSFGGADFDRLTLSFADPSAAFAIDNLTDVPEPFSMFLVGLGSIVLGGLRKFRSQSQDRNQGVDATGSALTGSKRIRRQA